jgi:hypothetical protein
MKKLLLLCVLLVGCTQAEYPTVNVPPSLRQVNWVSHISREGSCTHASVINLFRWQGRINTASYWRSQYSGGETPSSLEAKLRAEGIRFASTTNDVRFLEWACNTRRGCGVMVNGGKHMVALVHLDSINAGILDPNDPQNIIYVPREQFISEWLNSSGYAVAVVYTPAPPITWSNP